MQNWSSILRWVAAVPAAALGFITGFAIAVVIAGQFGTGGYMVAVATGTVLGSGAGILIAPRGQRRRAAQGFMGAAIGISAILLIVSLINHSFSPANGYDLGGTLIGGVIIWKLFPKYTIKPAPRQP